MTTNIPLNPQISTLDLRVGDRALGRILKLDVGREAPSSEADLAGDIFHNLYGERPLGESAPAERAVNRNLLEWAGATQGWKDAQANSRANLPVAMATSRLMWENLTTDEAVQNALKRQQEAEEAQRQAEANRLAAEAARQANYPNAEQLAQMAAQAQQAAAKAAQQAQDAAQALTGDPLNQAYITKAVKDAAKQGSQQAMIASGWGHQAGQQIRTDPQAAMEYMKRLTPKAAHIAKLAGRFRDIGSQARLNRVTTGFTPSGVELTKDFLKILPEQMALLSPNAPDVVRKSTMIEYARDGLLGWELTGEGQQRGPFVGAVDVSGSMWGQREITAKAISLGVAQVARQEDRIYSLFSFSSNHDDTIEVNSSDGWAEHLNWAEKVINGGTSFDLALLRSIDILKSMGEAGKAADLLFISDGEARVSPQVAEFWNLFRQQTGSRLYYVAVARGGYGSIEALADQVVSVADLDQGTGDTISKNVATWL